MKNQQLYQVPCHLMICMRAVEVAGYSAEQIGLNNTISQVLQYNPQNAHNWYLQTVKAVPSHLIHYEKTTLVISIHQQSTETSHLLLQLPLSWLGTNSSRMKKGCLPQIGTTTKFVFRNSTKTFRKAITSWYLAVDISLFMMLSKVEDSVSCLQKGQEMLKTAKNCSNLFETDAVNNSNNNLVKARFFTDKKTT